MLGLRLLRNPVQRYAWGSRTAIPSLIGQPAIPASEPPAAELWMGAHPSAPSRVVRDGEEVGLDQLAADDPGLLGARVAGRFGRLPFLFKLLAADRSLSIQCHPDAAAARRGFEREERLGVAIDARERSYRDASHKPELLVALGRFDALVGFRAPAEIRERLSRAGARELDGAIAGLEGEGGLAGFLASLLRLDAAASGAMLARAAERLAGDPGAEAAWFRRLLTEHPGDAAALAPLFLNLVELAADQAIFLDAGVLHAYLRGAGLELMASSDNVLRGGLTDKHIDVDELFAVLRAEPSAPAVLSPRAVDDRLRSYDTPAAEFRLCYVDVDGGVYERVRADSAGPEIVLSLAGQCRLTDLGTGDLVRLARGDAAIVCADVGSFQVHGAGGRVYFADVP
jgi:mannose-6-phosphate isomerase